MRTPQEIKDQEFQVKFRGCDPIEVKSYLEELAEDFFTLKEDVAKEKEEKNALAKEMDELTKSCTQLKADKHALEEELSQGGNNVAQIEEKVEKGYRYKDEQIAALTAEKQTLEQEKENLDVQLREKDLSQKALEENIKRRDQVKAEESAEVSALRTKVILLEDQIAELKKEGVDFKSTILVAQQFADELKEKASAEADSLVAEAKGEATLLNQETEVQRQQIQDELSRLGRLHEEVREDLSTKLHLVLDSLKILEAPAGVVVPDTSQKKDESLEASGLGVLDEVDSFFDTIDDEPPLSLS